MLPQQIHNIGNKFDDDAVLHDDLDNTRCPDKEGSCVSESEETQLARSSTSTSAPAKTKRRLPCKQEQGSF